MKRVKGRDAWVGLAMVVAALGVVGLVVVASGGPGYLVADRVMVDVLFRDGQGIRAGQPVRVAGLDAGRVAAVEVVDHRGSLRARVRLAIEGDLAARLKQDAVIQIQPGLTGQSSVNVASMGETGVAWVPGQPIEGVESSLFDPLLEEIGLGPVERGHLSHTVAAVRATIDEAGPHLSKILASLRRASGDIQGAAEVAGPAVADAAEQLREVAPKLQGIAERADSLVTRVDALVEEHGDGVGATIDDVRRVAAEARMLTIEQAPKVGGLLDQLVDTRKRLDMALYRVDTTVERVDGLIARNEPLIDRTLLNVRDISDDARMTVEKVKANPFILTPLYKPSRDAELAMASFETAQEYNVGARELSDAIRRLEALKNKPMPDPRQRQAIDQLLQRSYAAHAQLNAITQRMAQGVQVEPTRTRSGFLGGLGN